MPASACQRPLPIRSKTGCFARQSPLSSSSADFHCHSARSRTSASAPFPRLQSAFAPLGISAHKKNALTTYWTAQADTLVQHAMPCGQVTGQPREAGARTSKIPPAACCFASPAGTTITSPSAPELPANVPRHSSKHSSRTSGGSKPSESAQACSEQSSKTSGGPKPSESAHSERTEPVRL